ncbi:MAG: VOC family protein [Saprospiraceae bacterium]|nr:VOC family protein [Saprospiraceae bacterium]
MVSKFQHLVFYVNDLEESRAFFSQLLDLQLSALNHPDSSAAMKLANQEMRFMSFGFYHHDICLVKHRKLQFDNESLMHYTMVIRDSTAYDKILVNAQKMGIATKEGRMIKSAKMENHWKAFCFQDPNKHWIELILK